MTLDDQKKNRPTAGSIPMDEASFRGIYEALVDGVVCTDPNGVIVDANPAFSAIIGYACDEIVAKHIFDFTPQELQREEGMKVSNLIASGKSTGEIQKDFIHRDGHRVPVMARLWFRRDDQGECVGIWGIVHDLSAQRAAEARAAESEGLYRFIADSAEDVIWAIDNDMQYTYVSPSIKQLRGYTPQEILGTSFETSMTPESYRLVQDAMSRAMKAAGRGEREVTDRLELEMIRKDGSTVWTEVVGRAMIDENGSYIGIVGTTRDISFRREMEEKLRESEHSLRALLNASEDYMGLFKLGGVIVAANKALAHLTGSTVEEAVGKNIYDYLPEAAAVTGRAAVDRVLETRQPVTSEAVLFGRFMEGTIYPVIDEGGIPMVAAFAKDVTNVRNAEEERRRSQEQYRLIVETANEGILGLDADHRVTYANDILADFLGYHELEVIGRDITDFMDPEDIDEHVTRMAGRNKGQRERYERRFIRKDGSQVVGLVSATPMIGGDGEFLGSFAMIADITEMKQAHQRLLTILDGMDADIYVADFETHEILFMNKHMCNRGGRLKRGTTCHEFIHGQSVQCGDCYKHDLLNKWGRPVGTVISESYNEDSGRWSLNYDRAMEWLEGRLVHMHMATDITKLKNMEDELKKAIVDAEAANLSKNEFLANMSHEIRTPLNGLLGMLQLMELTDLEQTQREYLGTAHESGRNLLQILNDILDLSKVESGKLELEESDFELGDLLDSVVSVFRHQAEDRGISMYWTIDESLHRHFSADKGRLRQILFNLVGNAAKFTVSGAISVEAYPLQAGRTEDSSLIFFKVRDTGIGIPDDKVDAVFDPFTQVDGSLTRKFQGTGLGLGIVNRLVQLMGGSISIVSEVGEGTTIVFTVKASRVVHQQEAEAGMADAGQKESLSILVAEDERVNRIVIERILGKLGHRPTCVERGEDALEMLRERSFDLILTDIQMPGMDGVDTTRAIRKDLNIGTPVIALTAHAMKGDKKRFLEAGMNGYIAKPFELTELQAEIERVMAESAADQDES